MHVLAATLDHPGLFLGDAVGQSRAVEHDFLCVARAVVNPGLNVVARRRKWLWIANKCQTAIVARKVRPEGSLPGGSGGDRVSST